MLDWNLNQVFWGMRRALQHMIPRQHGCAYGTGNIKMWRDMDLLSGYFFEGCHYGLVVGHTALEEDVLSNPFLAHHLLYVVVDDGVGEAGGEVLDRGTALLVVDEVGLHEDGAALAEARRGRRLESEPGEVVPDGEVQPLRLLLEEGAGPGRAGVVHREVHHDALVDADELVQQERERLQLLQAEWEEKFREGEIEASLERAKLSRERQSLAKRQAELDDELEQLRQELRHDQDRKVSGRWRNKLGLAEG